MIKQISAIVTLITIFAITTVNAQYSTFKKGESQATVGVGIIPTFTGANTTTNVLPISTTIGYRVTDNFAVSAYAGYTQASTTPTLVNDGLLASHNNNFVMAGVRAELHAARFERIDIYGGAMLSYAKPFVKATNATTNEVVDLGPSTTNPYKNPAPKSTFLPSGFVGASYFITENLGAYVEIGYGVSILNTGLTIRL